MIHAYPDFYLSRAQSVLGSMLDYCVNTLNHTLEEIWDRFLVSESSREFAWGDSRIVAGLSGIELAWRILEMQNSDCPEPAPSDGYSPEYWTGWALAHYQWESTLEFDEITRVIPIGRIREMYRPYHEMDISSFVDEMNRLYRHKHPETQLKEKRLLFGLSQGELARMSGVPMRTIQQYEQRAKSINNARAESVAALARVLHCTTESLLERVPELTRNS